MGKRRYRRQEESLRQRIVEHRAKIAEEGTRAIPGDGLIQYWESEIRAFEAAVARARKRQGRTS